MGAILCLAAPALVCAAISYAILHDRYGDGLTGFCLGLFLGPLGILIACFIPVDPAAAMYRRWQNGEVSICATCHQYIQNGAQVCPYCHTYLYPAPQQQQY